jgi:hypothetical protein
MDWICTSRGAIAMKRFYRLCLLTTVISLAGSSALQAEDSVGLSRTPYVSPALTPDVLYRLRRIDARRLAAARAAALAQATANDVRPAVAPVVRPAAAAQPAPAVRPAPVIRPVSWGVRMGALSAYPAAVYGQTQSPAPPMPPASTAQGSYDAPAAAPATSTINPYKYAYAGRADAGSCYGSAYTSGYYLSGCYRTNACCRASRRLCTPCGGMCLGCTPGCYIAQTPPCPTTCAYGYPATGTTSAPPAYGTPTPVPSTTPSPPAPANPDAPPQPIERKVTPAPQANLFPRIPGLPPGA